MKKNKNSKKPIKRSLKQKNPPQSKRNVIKSDFSNFLGLTIIGVLGIIVYSNSFDCSFHLDDLSSIVENRSIRDISDLKAIWSYSPSRFIAYYTFAINYHFGGLAVEGYHFLNLFIHLFNASIVYWLTLLIFSSPALKNYPVIKDKNIIAFATALLFVSHPLATQSVTYIVQRMASMVTLFYLLSLAFYMKTRLNKEGGWIKYAMIGGSIIFAILAMFTKQNAVTLPFAIMLIEICFFQSKKIKINFKDYRVIILIVALMVFILIFLSNYFNANIFKPHSPGYTNDFSLITSKNYLLTQFSVIVKYLQLLILPLNQNLDYDFKLANSFFEIRTIMSFLFLLSLVIFAWVKYKKNRILTFGILWFFLTLAVESSIIPIDDLIFEHRTYLPSFGFFIILSYSIYLYLWQKHKKIAITIFGIIIASNSLMTYERNEIWKDDFSLWNDSVSKSPNKARALNNRGIAFFEKQMNYQALKDYNKVISLQPNYAVAYYNRGNIFKNEKQLQKAIIEYNKAIELDPNHFRAYNNRGAVFKDQKKLQSALEDYTVAIKLNPYYFMAYNNRGEIYALSNDYSKALIDLNKAIELNPDMAIAFGNRAVAEAMLGNHENSCQDYKRAIELGLKQAEAAFLRNCQ